MSYRELCIIRHAHAAAASASGRDFDRPLSERGEAQVPVIAEWLRAQQVAADVVLCSPALRTRATLAGLLVVLEQPELIYDERIYEATPGTLMSLLEPLQATARVLLVGHNPGLEQIVALLCDGRSSDARGLPTGAVARLRWPSERGLEPANAELMAFWSP